MLFRSQLVKQSINSMSEEHKKDLLEKIKFQNGLNVLLGKRVQAELLNYTVDILKGKNPNNPQTFRRSRRILSSRVRIIKEASK